MPLHNLNHLRLDVDSLFTIISVQDSLQFLIEILAPYSDHFPLALDKIIIKLNYVYQITSFHSGSHSMNKNSGAAWAAL